MDVFWELYMLNVFVQDFDICDRVLGAG